MKQFSSINFSLWVMWVYWSFFNACRLSPDSVHEVRETFDTRGDSDKYPEEVPEFKTTLLALRESCHPLIHFLNRILAKALKLDNLNYFCENSKWMKDENHPTMSAFRALYYPAIPDASKIQPGTVRCAEHTDYGTLTLLFQDQIGGLEVNIIWCIIYENWNG